MEIKYSELKNKKVVNILDGKVIGTINDIIFDEDYHITAFVCGKVFIVRGEEYLINTSCIEKIGEDAVLVKLLKKEC